MSEAEKQCPVCGRRFEGKAIFCQVDGTRLESEQEPDDPYLEQVLLDQFKIEERIGAGGMGAVYRARQLSLHRDVAVKILHPELADNPDAVRRFKREARVCTALDHPNVVRVLLLGQLPSGNLYIVMEYIAGRSLLEVIAESGTLSVERALHLIIQICDGVGQAHHQGIVHRDLKPENIVVSERRGDADFVKVLDFGIARLLCGDEQTMATQSGLVFGTARYISPEGAGGEVTDARSDVYSIGVMLYQLLCGHTPFEASTPVGLLMKHMHADPPELASQVEDLPAGLSDLVMRTLLKNPEGRFENAAALAEELRDLAEVAGYRIGRLSRTSNVTPGYMKSIDTPVDPVSTVRAARGDMEEAIQPSSVPKGDAVGPHETTADLMRRARTRGLRPSFWIAVMMLCALSGMGVYRAFDEAPEANHDEERLHALALRARDALEHQHYDGEGEDTVLALTDAILVEDPAHREALRLRTEASRQLVHDAEQEVVRGDLEAARALYRRALALEASESTREALVVLDEPQRVPIAEGSVYTQPESVTTRTPVRLIVELVPGPDDGDISRPRFEVHRIGADEGMSLRARSAGPNRFEVRTRLRRVGRYEVRFLASRNESPFEVDGVVEVARGVTRSRRDRDENAAPTTTQVAPTTTRVPSSSAPRDAPTSPRLGLGELLDPVVRTIFPSNSSPPSEAQEEGPSPTRSGPNRTPPAPWSSQ